jgi:hypothetical protein
MAAGRGCFSRPERCREPAGSWVGSGFDRDRDGFSPSSVEAIAMTAIRA